MIEIEYCTNFVISLERNISKKCAKALMEISLLSKYSEINDDQINELIKKKIIGNSTVSVKNNVSKHKLFFTATSSVITR